MNFSISSGIGFLGGWVLFGALMMVFTVVVTMIVRVVRGRDEKPTEANDGHTPEDDYIL